MDTIRKGELRVFADNPDPTNLRLINIDPSRLSELAKYPEIYLRFGTFTVSANIMPQPSDVATYDKLLVSGDIIQQLCLPNIENIGVAVCENNVIFGPLIGIFVSGWEIGNLSQGTCKNRHFYNYIIACRELNAICCFFCLGDISWEQRLIKGWIFQGDKGPGKKWISIIVPIPAVIYDRCFGSQGKADGDKLRSHLSDIPGVIVFNAMPKLKKWETYELLRTCSDIEGCLPKTMLYSGPKRLMLALNKLGPVYLKPDGLSKGTGVFKISRKPKGFLIKHRGPKRNEVFEFYNLKHIDKLLEPYSERGGGYLIQQEIPLARYKGRKFDMRVLCQKDIKGQWIIGGIAVRVAAPGSIITSPRSGGSVVSWAHTLKTVFNQQENLPNGVASKVRDIAFKVCSIIEEHYGCCGELGLDIGIDANGKVWIIEVNAKPLKVSLKRLLDPVLTQQIHANPIRFAYYLACKPQLGVN